MPHSCARPRFPRLNRHENGEELAPTVRRPTHEEIARLAYSYWEDRGCHGGSPVEDWHRAERTLRDR